MVFSGAERRCPAEHSPGGLANGESYGIVHAAMHVEAPSCLLVVGQFVMLERSSGPVTMDSQRSSWRAIGKVICMLDKLVMLAHRVFSREQAEEESMASDESATDLLERPPSSSGGMRAAKPASKPPRSRGASAAFLTKLRDRYPAGQSSESMTNAVRATAKRAADGYVFKTGEEMGLRPPRAK